MTIIGIIERKSVSEENHSIHIVYDDIVDVINKNNAICIGITLKDNYKMLINMCDGLIFQGGDDLESYELEALKYAYEINKPTLGICMGMQSMGVLFDGNLIKINNHKNKIHKINVVENTKLYNIFKKEYIEVNSRHNYVLESTKLKISALSSDGYIEAIEDSSKKFFIGVQWHPESMIKYSSDQNKIFEEFINSCK